jgi:hypothetical protein
MTGRTSSNRLIVGGRGVPLPASLVVERGFSLSNYLDDGEHRFAATKRRVPVVHFVLHESVTRTAAGVIRVLEAKAARSRRQRRNRGAGYRYGVHLILAPDGHVSQHADLLEDRLVHANQLNASSIGCEIVNPYAARRPEPPFDRTMPRRWWTWVPPGAPPLYTLPTDAQLEALVALVPVLVDALPQLPLAFPTTDLGPRRRRIAGWDQGVTPAPGIVAHRDFSSHADGRFPLEHLVASFADSTSTNATG